MWAKADMVNRKIITEAEEQRQKYDLLANGMGLNGCRKDTIQHGTWLDTTLITITVAIKNYDSASGW